MCCKNNYNTNKELQERLAHLEIKSMLNDILERLDDIELFMAEIACLCDEEIDELEELGECGEGDADVCHTCCGESST